MSSRDAATTLRRYIMGARNPSGAVAVTRKEALAALAELERKQ